MGFALHSPPHLPRRAGQCRGLPSDPAGRPTPAATGVRFFLGTGLSDEDRNHPPAVGSVVTFRYFALSRDNQG